MTEALLANLIEANTSLLNSQIDLANGQVRSLKDLGQQISSTAIDIGSLRKRLLRLKLDEAGLDYCSFSPSSVHHAWKLKTASDLPDNGLFPKNRLTLIYLHLAKGDREFTDDLEMGSWDYFTYNSQEGGSMLLQVCDDPRHVHIRKPELFAKYPLAEALLRSRGKDNIYTQKQLKKSVLAKHVERHAGDYLLTEDNLTLKIDGNIEIKAREYHIQFAREDDYEYFGVPKKPNSLDTSRRINLL